VAPWWWFSCKPKYVGAVFLIWKCFNSSTFFNVVCISWKLKCWILLMHGVTMKFTSKSVSFLFQQHYWKIIIIFIACKHVTFIIRSYYVHMAGLDTKWSLYLFRTLWYSNAQFISSSGGRWQVVVLRGKSCNKKALELSHKLLYKSQLLLLLSHLRPKLNNEL